MYTRNLYIEIPVLIILLITAVSLSAVFFYKGELFYGFVLLLPVLIIVVLLFYVINHTNRKIAFFFDSVCNEDLSLVFPEVINGKALQELNRSLNRTNKLYAKMREESETNELFYKSLINHAKTGLMAVNNEGRIMVINPAMESLFEYFILSEISDFSQIDPGIPDIFNRLEPGKPEILSIIVDHKLQQLLINKAILSLKNNPVSIFSVENIKNELDNKEMESWIRIIRVLNHEIANAVTPISSMSTTIRELFHKDGQLYIDGITEEIISDTADALRNIDEHAQGLMRFVSSYRELTHLPKPEYRHIQLTSFLRDEINTLNNKLEKKDIEVSLQIDPEELLLLADPGLIQRVFSNIILNAIQSMENCTLKRINISAGTDLHNRTFVKIADTGEGIRADHLEQVFVPFFSTKEEGSGIGLSLCRQIMQLHNGDISIVSEPGKGTEVSLLF